MQVCSKCGKENQNHYKFCLGCGNEMPSEGISPEAPPPAAQAPVSPTPPAGMPRVEQPEALPAEPRSKQATPSFVSAPTEPVTPEPQVNPAPVAAPANAGSQAAQVEPEKIFCTACGAANPVGFGFCGGCGAKLKKPLASTDFYGSSAGEEEPEAPKWGRLCLIKPDGSMGGTFTLQGDEVDLGREAGELFAHDGYLSPVHARMVREGSEVILEDSSSLNGVFIKITGEETLADGDVFRLGQELLRFDVVREPEVLEDGTEIMGSPNPDYWGRLSLIAGPDIDGSAFPLMGDEVMLGRERGDILFPDDGYVSGIHAKISITEAGFVLSDLGSSNGTFLRLIEPRTVGAGTYILMGQQLFLMEME